MKLIENNIQKIIDLCKKHKVHKLFVFGSILTNRFNNNSDIDLVVDFNKKEVNDYFDNWLCGEPVFYFANEPLHFQLVISIPCFLSVSTTRG